MAGPGDEMAVAAAGRGRVRASRADREQAIEVLKVAFVQDRLTKDELDVRLGHALAARTGAELAALTADIPAWAGPVRPPARARRRPPAPARRRPLARAAAGSGSCLVVAAASVWAAFILDPGPAGPTPSWVKSFLLLALCAVFTALIILGCGVAASLEQRRSRNPWPPRARPGGHALDDERHGGTGHRLVPPAPRADQTRADLQTDSSLPDRPHSPRARWPDAARHTPSAGRGVTGTFACRVVQSHVCRSGGRPLSAGIITGASRPEGGGPNSPNRAS